MSDYYFIGIKGTGMAALACMLHDLGHFVSGSDLENHFFTEEGLRERGIEILSFDEKNIKDNTNVIIGNAFLENFPEVEAARKNPTCTCKRYHEFVGEFIKPYQTIAVSGSHGKTTTTGLLASALGHVKKTGWLIGDGSGSIAEDTEFFCLEADEFRRHFLAYYPEYAIITNVDIDHVDYFKNKEDYRSAYEAFSEQVSKGIVICSEDEETHKLKLNPNVKHYWYGLSETDDIRAVNVNEGSRDMEFDVICEGKEFGHFNLPFVGHHLLLNSLAVIGICYLEGLSAEEIEEGLCKFEGVKRRFVVEEIGENVYIDDYAHHPTEVRVTIETARLRYPDRKLVAIFKPHRASRVYYFADDFAKALRLADKVYLCDFTSIDDKQDGVEIDITFLQAKLEESIILSEDEEGAKLLSEEKPCVYLFMSSKDIYWLAEIVKEINQ